MLPNLLARLCLAALLVTTTVYAVTQWQTQPTSALQFTGTQAGARFSGTFEQFDADIRFDPQDLAGSRFDVTIDLTSTNTQDGERDQIIKGPDLFGVERWPQARYLASEFTALGDNRFRAVGPLTIRGVTRNVPIVFRFVNGANGARLKGVTTIKRLDFGVGQGDWKDTQWVGNDVSIAFDLELKP